MKVCLYFENYENIKQSGVGKAMQHQVAALKSNNIEFTYTNEEEIDYRSYTFIGIRLCILILFN